MASHRAMCVAAILGGVIGIDCLPRAEASILMPGLKARAEAYDYTTGPSVGDAEIDPGMMVGPLMRAEAIAARDFSTSRAFAEAAYGYLRVETSTIGVYSSITSATSVGQAVASASFVDDQVVVQREGIATGTPGTFRARFDVQRVIDFAAALSDGLAAGMLVLEGGYSLGIVIGQNVTEIDGSALGGTWRRIGVDGVLQEPDVLPPGIVELDVDFEYGVPFTIAVQVQVNLFTFISNGGTAEVDSRLLLGPSFRWLGIVDGLDDDTTVSSPEVENWKDPAIPAPGTLALVGVCALGLARRRR